MSKSIFWRIGALHNGAGLEVVFITAAAIAAGTLNPFKGPITKQDGTVVETVDDGMILGMNWYVKGVDDKLPQ